MPALPSREVEPCGENPNNRYEEVHRFVEILRNAL
jgi:hypothetical protein